MVLKQTDYFLEWYDINIELSIQDADQDHGAQEHNQRDHAHRRIPAVQPDLPFVTGMILSGKTGNEDQEAQVHYNIQYALHGNPVKFSAKV